MAEAALSARIRALIVFRALIITLLLGSAFLFRVEYVISPRAISVFIICLYILTIAYAVLQPRIRNYSAFAYTQFFIDIIAELILIALTGGIESWFPFMFILTILSASIVLNKKAGYITASAISMLYAVLLDLQLYQLLPIPYSAAFFRAQFFYKIFIHTISFYLTAFLSGYLSFRLKATEAQLEQKDLFLRDLELFNTKVIESLPSGLFTTDLSSRIVIFNRAAEKITGMSKETVVGKTAQDVFPFLRSPLIAGRYEEHFAAGPGTKKIIGITISILKDTAGRETGFICIFQDLTELKKLEMEMKRTEQWAAIGELSANIAHEIRNPLASLKGSIEMLREGKVPAHHRDHLMSIALDEMERLNNIITDFLTYSSPKPLALQSVDVTQLLNTTIDLLDNQSPSGTAVRINKNLDGPAVLMADPGKLRQVFWNIGVNAMEAMAGQGTLTASVARDGSHIAISFTDTGPGIPPGDIDRIFFPFFTTKERGTGLGLSIAYRIIEEHRGKIVVKSSPAGTTFRILLEANGHESRHTDH
ncbi:MAG: ATP-binding protein [Thermodesulfovibrionales bacterium]